MSNKQNTFTFIDEAEGIDNLLNMIRADSSLEGTVKRSDALTMLMHSIEYGLSLESGVPIKIKLKSNVIDVYAKRVIEEMPVDFDEISELNAEGMPVIDENNATFAVEYLKSIPISALTSLHQNTIKTIARKFNQMILNIEKEKEYELFKDKKNQLIEGIVVRIEAGNVIVDINGSEGVLPKTELINNEFCNIGDKITAYIRDVRLNEEGQTNPYQILLNRSSPEFVAKLVEANVPEISIGSIVIKDCARRPGRLTKISLSSADPFIDPVWPCIGKGGTRLKHIRSLMANEGLHIIRWSNSSAEYICNALYPLEVIKIIFESDNEAEVILSEQSFNQALSRNKIQIKLAASLTKFRIKVTSENEDTERVAQQKAANEKLMKEVALNEEELITLNDLGINSVEEIAECTDEELTAALPNTDIEQLRNKINSVMRAKILNEYSAHGIDPILLNMPNLAFDAPILSQYGIKTKNDLLNCGINIIVNMLKKQLYGSDIMDDEMNNLALIIKKWAETEA